eukprot:scaffold1231_cov187-Pinguiococcus_pyrenoidosus.AAC.16
MAHRLVSKTVVVWFEVVRPNANAILFPTRSARRNRLRARRKTRMRIDRGPSRATLATISSFRRSTIAQSSCSCTPGRRAARRE